MNEAFTNLNPPNYLAYPDFRHGMMVRGQIMGVDVEGGIFIEGDNIFLLHDNSRLDGVRTKAVSTGYKYSYLLGYTNRNTMMYGMELVENGIELVEETPPLKWVYTNYVPESSMGYLTPNKRYELTTYTLTGGDFVCDNGATIHICFSGSSHIDGKSWIVVDAPMTPAEQILLNLPDGQLKNEIRVAMVESPCPTPHQPISTIAELVLHRIQWDDTPQGIDYWSGVYTTLRTLNIENNPTRKDG